MLSKRTWGVWYRFHNKMFIPGRRNSLFVSPNDHILVDFKILIKKLFFLITLTLLCIFLIAERTPSDLKISLKCSRTLSFFIVWSSIRRVCNEVQICGRSLGLVVTREYSVGTNIVFYHASCLDLLDYFTKFPGHFQ